MLLETASPPESKKVCMTDLTCHRQRAEHVVPAGATGHPSRQAAGRPRGAAQPHRDLPTQQLTAEQLTAAVEAGSCSCGLTALTEEPSKTAARRWAPCRRPHSQRESPPAAAKTGSCRTSRPSWPSVPFR